MPLAFFPCRFMPLRTTMLCLIWGAGGLTWGRGWCGFDVAFLVFLLGIPTRLQRRPYIAAPGDEAAKIGRNNGIRQ